MQKNIPFRGLTTTPSAHACPDGDLAAVMNLIPEDGELKPLHQPFEIGRMEKGAQLWVHETPDFLHYIKRTEDGQWWWSDRMDAAEPEESTNTITVKVGRNGIDVYSERRLDSLVEEEDVANMRNKLTLSHIVTEDFYLYPETIDPRYEGDHWHLCDEAFRVLSVRGTVYYHGVNFRYVLVHEQGESISVPVGKVLTVSDVAVGFVIASENFVENPMNIGGDMADSIITVNLYRVEKNGDVEKKRYALLGANVNKADIEAEYAGYTLLELQYKRHFITDEIPAADCSVQYYAQITYKDSIVGNDGYFAVDDQRQCVSEGGTEAPDTEVDGSQEETTEEDTGWICLDGITGEPTSVAHNGNVLIIACKDQPVQYAIWRGAEYSYLGQFPEMDLEFKLEGEVLARNFTSIIKCTKQEIDNSGDESTYTNLVRTYTVSGVRWEQRADEVLGNGTKYYIKVIDVVETQGSVLHEYPAVVETSSGRHELTKGQGFFGTFAIGEIFKLSCAYYQQDGFDYPIDIMQQTVFGIYSNTEKEEGKDDYSDRSGYTVENNPDSLQAVLGCITRYSLAYSENRGKFVYPFFVKYGLKLKSEDIIFASAPILMIPNWGVAPSILVHYKEGDAKSDVQLQAFMCDLYYRITRMSGIDRWSDIVSELVICISSPIIKADVGAEWIEEKKFFTTYPMTEEVFADRYSIQESKRQLWDAIIDRNSANFLLDPPLLNDQAFLKHLQMRMRNFYLIHKTKCSNAQTDVWTKVDASEHNVMFPETDDAVNFSNIVGGNIMAKEVIVYNGRTHLVNMKEILSERGMAISSVIPRVTDNAKYRIVVYLQKDGKEVKMATDTVCGDPYHCIFFYSDDSDAYKMDIYYDTGYLDKPIKKATVLLVNHEYIEGVYALVEGGLQWGDATRSEMTAEYEKIIVSHSNEIYISEVDNPFVFPASNAISVGRGEIKAIAVNTETVSEGQFGDAPLYAMTDEETWLLSASSSGLYEAKQPLTGAACVNTDNVCQLPNAVVFCTANGIILAQGKQMTNIGDSLRDMVSNITLPHLGEVMEAKGLANRGDELEEYVYGKNWLTFLHTCGMAYDNINERLIVYPQDSDLAFVYSMRSGMWGMQQLDIKGKVAKAGQAWVITSAKDKAGREVQVVSDLADTDYCKAKKEYPNQFLITRPMGLDAADVLKRVRSMIARGYFRKGHVATAMYGSRDLFSWRLVWTSKDHYLRGFSGTPYKYYSVVLVCNLGEDERLQGLDFDYDGSMMNQMR